MILGAGVFQLTAIRRAVELGFHVISVDYKPSNVGHAYAHESVNASTIDADAVLAAAKAHHVDGIFSMASEVALPTIARVASELGLPGPSVETVQTLTQKNRFRSAQKAQRLDGPIFLESEDFDEAARSWGDGPAIIKPAMSSGSRGVVRVPKLDEAARALFEAARAFSSTGVVTVEAFVPGQDLTLEGFVIDGRVDCALATKKHIEGFSVVGHELPPTIDVAMRQRLIQQVEQMFAATGYRSGPFDADFRIEGDSAVLLEMSPRLGGNGVPALIEAGYGVSLLDLALRAAVGIDGRRSSSGGLIPPREAALPPPESSRRYASVLLRSGVSGTVAAVADAACIRAELFGMAELCLNLRVGDEVRRFIHGGDVFGFCVVPVASDEMFSDVAGRVHEALALKLAS
ncbi:MAG: ATP-grasp domain-containing protein [Deltaproteobacteria bacterium]|nr:ATP-grasp domain-containing protein [Deltaproteobacteria bacterium]